MFPTTTHRLNLPDFLLELLILRMVLHVLNARRDPAHERLLLRLWGTSCKAATRSSGRSGRRRRGGRGGGTIALARALGCVSGGEHGWGMGWAGGRLAGHGWLVRLKGNDDKLMVIGGEWQGLRKRETELRAC